MPILKQTDKPKNELPRIGSLLLEIGHAIPLNSETPNNSISVIQVDLSSLSPIPCSDSTVNKYSVQSEIFVIYV